MKSIAVRPEHRLLLCCARTIINGETAARTQALLNQEIDWHYFLDGAVHHRVVPLIWHTVSNRSDISFPALVARDLRVQASAIARRSLFLTVELTKLVELFRCNDIRVIAYKGPTGALLCYGNLSLRQFGDLDVLVHPQDYAKSQDLLTRRGYSTSADWGWECSLRDASGLVCVDLHQHIVPDVFSVRLDFDSLWKHAERLSVGGADVHTLCPEDMLVVLCVQLIKDSWGESVLRLSKLCDIAELLSRHTSLNWDVILERTYELGCRRILWLCLALAQDLLGAPASGSIPSIPSRARLRSLEEHVVFRLFDPPPLGSVKRLSGADFHFHVRERWSDKFYPRYCRLKSALTPNDRDFAAVSLPEGLHWLYYIIRPARLIRESTGSLFRRNS